MADQGQMWKRKYSGVWQQVRRRRLLREPLARRVRQLVAALVPLQVVHKRSLQSHHQRLVPFLTNGWESVVAR